MKHRKLQRYMLNDTKRLLAKSAAIDRGLEELRGSADFGNFAQRPGGSVAWRLCQRFVF